MEEKMDTDITVQPTTTATPSIYTREAIDLIKKVIAPDLNDAELQLFLWNANRMGLDPLARQLYAVKRSGRMTLQIGIDGFRVVANRNGLAGIEEAVHDDEKADHPMWSKVTVYRFIGGERIPFTATARWAEYNVPNNSMWKKMPYLMLDKCAEALALRKGFPNELSGVYTTDEMMQAGKEEPVAVEPEEFTDEQMRALEFTTSTGTKVSVGDIMKREDAKATLEKLLKFVTDPTHKCMIARALDLIANETKIVEGE
jgi:phage recombination protein Bet